MTYAGPTYLVSGGELPWTPEDIRAHLGLRSTDFDQIIGAVIASQCINHGVCFHGQVWAVARGDDLADFFKRANKGGKLVKIGPAYLRGTVTYHDCEVGPDPVKARKAFRAIVRWCRGDEGIYRALVNEARTPVRGADLSPAVAAE